MRGDDYDNGGEGLNDADAASDAEEFAPDGADIARVAQA